jgi:hypothetical protein
MTESTTADLTQTPPGAAPAAPAPAHGAWLAVAGFVLGVGSFVLWAAFGLPAPLVAVLALALGYVAVRRSGGGAQGRGSRLARWALRLGTAHLIGWAAFVALLAVLGVFAVSSLGV